MQEEDSPWESGNVWSNLALYLFTLHIPFSFGGLSVVALFNGQPVLDPQTEVTFVICSFISQNHLIKPRCHPNIRILFCLSSKDLCYLISLVRKLTCQHNITPNFITKLVIQMYVTMILLRNKALTPNK